MLATLQLGYSIGLQYQKQPTDSQLIALSLIGLKTSLLVFRSELNIVTTTLNIQSILLHASLSQTTAL